MYDIFTMYRCRLRIFQCKHNFINICNIAKLGNKCFQVLNEHYRKMIYKCSSTWLCNESFTIILFVILSESTLLKFYRLYLCSKFYFRFWSRKICLMVEIITKMYFPILEIYTCLIANERNRKFNKLKQELMFY